MRRSPSISFERHEGTKGAGNGWHAKDGEENRAFAAMSARESSGVVAVLCGDPVVARIIGNLLQTVGYESRPAEEVPPEDIAKVSLLFIAPGAEVGDLDSGLSPFGASGVPILDLSGSSWPYRIEEIKGAVDEALSATVAELTPEIPLEPGTETA